MPQATRLTQKQKDERKAAGSSAVRNEQGKINFTDDVREGSPADRERKAKAAAAARLRESQAEGVEEAPAKPVDDEPEAAAPAKDKPADSAPAAPTPTPAPTKDKAYFVKKFGPLVGASKWNQYKKSQKQ